MNSKNIMISQKDKILQILYDRDPMNPGIISGQPGRYIAYERGYGEQYDNFAVAAVLALTMPGIGSQIRNIPALFAGRLTITRVGQFYGPTLLGLPTFGGIALGYFYDKLIQSIGQDGKPGVSTPSLPPRKPIGTKPSKPIISGLTQKPFWSSGKPKCKKGFRYDFKRKLCVKIK